MSSALSWQQIKENVETQPQSWKLANPIKLKAAVWKKHTIIQQKVNGVWVRTRYSKCNLCDWSIGFISSTSSSTTLQIRHNERYHSTETENSQKQITEIYHSYQLSQKIQIASVNYF